jgi:beta-phosphoglucomutase
MMDTPSSRQAVLWDMDGTIVNSLSFHQQAWKATFASRGIDFTDEDFKFSNGRINEEIVPHFLGQNLSQEEVKAVGDEKEATFRRLVKGSIQALPGVMKLIKSLAEAGYQLAIVSSTPQENIELISKTLGIKKYFGLFVNGDDVQEGKPSPQAFLFAAKKLGVGPENCVVIEDAVVGVKAAKRAGMYCIRVTNTAPAEKIAEADMVVDNLEEITVKTIAALFLRNNQIKE